MPNQDEHAKHQEVEKDEFHDRAPLWREGVVKRVDCLSDAYQCKAFGLTPRASTRCAITETLLNRHGMPVMRHVRWGSFGEDEADIE